MADIIELLERRDEGALEQLQTHYRDYCRTILLRLLGNEEEAEEALSDVWMQVWNAIPPARPRHLKAYLAQTARNIAINRIRRDNTAKRSGTTVLLDELEECIPDPRWECDGENLKELLRKFLASLGAEEKRIFMRRYWYGDTIQELAKESKCTENRITGILFRTRNKLRKYLESEGYEV